MISRQGCIASPVRVNASLCGLSSRFMSGKLKTRANGARSYTIADADDTRETVQAVRLIGACRRDDRCPFTHGEFGTVPSQGQLPGNVQQISVRGEGLKCRLSSNLQQKSMSRIWEGVVVEHVTNMGSWSHANGTADTLRKWEGSLSFRAGLSGGGGFVCCVGMVV